MLDLRFALRLHHGGCRPSGRAPVEDGCEQLRNEDFLLRLLDALRKRLIVRIGLRISWLDVGISPCAVLVCYFDDDPVRNRVYGGGDDKVHDVFEIDEQPVAIGVLSALRGAMTKLRG